MSFCDNLQYLRKRDKITQEELAEKLQVSRQSVSKWETGEAYPETEKIIALCDIFDVTMDCLMRGDVAASAKTEPRQSAAADTEEEAPRTYPQPDGGNVGTKEGDMPDCSDGAKNHAWLKIAGEVINVLVMLGAIVSYLCMGSLLNLWHPGWLVFPLALSIWAFTDAVFIKPYGLSKNFSRLVGSRIFTGLSGMTMILSATIYLFIGCVYGIWHPSWVIFIIALCAVVVFDCVSKALSGKDAPYTVEDGAVEDED